MNALQMKPGKATMACAWRAYIEHSHAADRYFDGVHSEPESALATLTIDSVREAAGAALGSVRIALATRHREVAAIDRFGSAVCNVAALQRAGMSSRSLAVVTSLMQESQTQWRSSLTHSNLIDGAIDDAMDSLEGAVDLRTAFKELSRAFTCRIAAFEALEHLVNDFNDLMRRG